MTDQSCPCTRWAWASRQYRDFSPTPGGKLFTCGTNLKLASRMNWFTTISQHRLKRCSPTHWFQCHRTVLHTLFAGCVYDHTPSGPSDQLSFIWKISHMWIRGKTPLNTVTPPPPVQTPVYQPKVKKRDKGAGHLISGLAMQLLILQHQLSLFSVKAEQSGVEFSSTSVKLQFSGLHQERREAWDDMEPELCKYEIPTVIVKTSVWRKRSHGFHGEISYLEL